jgi:HEAT repeat protein
MNENQAERDSTPPPDQPLEGEAAEFSRALAQAQKQFGTGSLPPEIALRLTRTRESEAAQFCLNRLAENSPVQSDLDLVRQLCQIEGAANRLVDLLLRENSSTAKTVALALVKLGTSFQQKFASRLNSDDLAVVANAIDILELLGDNKLIVPALFSLLNRPSSDIRAKAASLIQKLDTRFVYTRRLLRHSDPRVRASTLQSIMGRSEPQVGDYLSLCSADPDSRIRSLAALGLCRRGDPTGKKVLSEMLKDPDPLTRLRAVWALGIEADSEIAPVLETLQRDNPDEQVRKQAAQSLAKIARQAGHSSQEHSKIIA